MKPSRSWAALCSLTFSIFIAASANAQTDFWDGSNSANWFNNGNWSLNHPPSLLENAQVNDVSINFARINNPGATARSLSVGTNSGETGEVRVTDDGTLSVGSAGNSGPFTIGNAGTGRVLLSDTSSTFVTENNLIVGSQSGSNGDLVIRDTAHLTVDGALRVGDSGTGSLSIRDDGQAGVTRLDVGTFNGGIGEVDLHDASGAFFNMVVSQNASIGTSGMGTLTARDAGSMHVLGSMFIGNNADGVGKVVVRGQDPTGAFVSYVVADQNLDVGAAGDGTLEVRDGGLAQGENVRIGRDSGSTGRVLVTGVGPITGTSSLRALNDLSVGGTQSGPGGDGELRIINNGMVNVGNNMFVWGSGNGSGNEGVLAIDSTYTLLVNSVLTFDGGRLHFLEDGVDFVNDATLNNTADPDSVGMYVDTDDHTDTISGLLSGPGRLVKQGTGTLIITNDNINTGRTIIENGTLQLDGAVGGTVSVRANGTLTGVYDQILNNVGRNLRNRGIVSPGDNPGDPATFQVTGNFINRTTGSYFVDVGGLAQGVDTDLLQMFGTATLEGGTLQATRVNNFMPMVGDRVVVLQADLGRTGEFDTVVPIGFGLIQPVADYSDPDQVALLFELSQTFGSQALTPNQKAVGHGLDHALADGCVPDLVTFVGNITPLEALPHVYDLIAPEELAAVYEIGISQAMVHNDNLMRRMDDIRAGSNGYCGPVLQPAMTASNPPISDKNVVIPDKNVVMDKNVAPLYVPCPENHWGIFATGTGDFVNVDGDGNAHGYDIDTGSFIAGVDYRIGNHFAIGIDGGYASSRADLVDHGHIDVDGGKVGGYATVYGFKFLGGKIHLDGGVNGGWNSYDTRRTGLSSEFADGESVNGDTNGSEFNAFVSYGTDYNFGCLTIGTWSTIQYTNVSIDSFTEEGSLAPLHIQDQDQDSFRGSTGVRASYDIRFGHCGIIRPEIRAAWQHESSDRSYAIDANFIDCDDTFTVHGPKIGRDSALVGAGLNVQWCARFATYVNYDGVLGRDNYTNNAVSGGLRLGF